MKKPTPEEIRKMEQELMMPVSSEKNSLDFRLEDLTNLSLKDYIKLSLPFHESLKELAKRNYRLINPRENAYLRIKAGKEHEICKNGNYTSAGFVYAKNSYPILVLDSPLLDPILAQKAAVRNQIRRYFCTGDTKLYEKYFEQAEQDFQKQPEQRMAVVLPFRQNGKIFLNDKSAALRVLLKDQAEDYLNFIRDDGLSISLAEANTVDSFPGTTLIQLWFSRLEESKGLLDGENVVLNFGICTRGVPIKQGGKK